MEINQLLVEANRGFFVDYQHRFVVARLWIPQDLVVALTISSFVTFSLWSTVNRRARPFIDWGFVVERRTS